MAAALVEKLRGDAAQREEAYAELLQRESAHYHASACSAHGSSPEQPPPSASPDQRQSGALADVADVALVVASPLCEILCKPVSEVDAREFCRASNVLAAMTGVDPRRVGGECLGNPDCCNLWNVYAQPANALGVTLAKQPASLTAEDAINVACVYAPLMVAWSTADGLDAPVEAAGRLTTMEFMDFHIPAMFMCNIAEPFTDDARYLELLPLLLELIKMPQNLPEFALPGALFALAHGTAGRVAAATKLLQLDAIAVYMALLRQASPTELVSANAHRPHGVSFWCAKELIEASQNGGADVTGQLLSCGFIDSLLSMINAAEQVGEEGCNAEVVIFGGLHLLKLLDGEQLPRIEDKLRSAMPSALRFVITARFKHCAEFGITSGAAGTVLAANLYGKDEGNAFGLAQNDVDGLVLHNTELLRCDVWGSIWNLSSNMCRGLLSLCISDTAKEMLLNHPGFIPHLLDGLLLDPAHPRADSTSLEIKSHVQRDYAECIQQISLYPPGGEALKTAEHGVTETLNALIENAWSEEAKECARGALAQLTEYETLRSSKTAAAAAAAGVTGHAMISYQWSHQELVKRIVNGLNERGYVTWFDLHNMKGAALDAMSDAVDNAEIMISCISELYKESANCRLECQYGHQRGVDMVPLMMVSYSHFSQVRDATLDLAVQLSFVSHNGNIGLTDGLRRSESGKGLSREWLGALSLECGGRIDVVASHLSVTCLLTFVVHVDIILHSNMQLGLLLGSRLYFKFHAEAIETDALFNQQMDAVARAMGERGKSQLKSAPSPPHEGLPPATMQVQALAQATLPAAKVAAPASMHLTPATASTQAPSAPCTSTVELTPSVRRQQQQEQPLPSSASQQLAVHRFGADGNAGIGSVVVNAAEIVAMLKQERHEARSEIVEELHAMKAEAEALRAASALQQQQETDALKQRLRAQQLTTLHARLERMHTSKLLSEEELQVLEDLVADGYLAIEERKEEEEITKLLVLAERMTVDGSFSRQLRRKFL